MAELWRRLVPQSWPLPLEALPSASALVGGAVRDGLLDRLGAKPDLDLVVPGDAIALAQVLAKRHGGTCVLLDAERSIARLVIQGWTIDLARQEGGSLEADLGRRDFTVNAIALPLAPGAALVDPSGGLQHLQQRQLVAVRERNLCDDPLRLLRGMRLAAELGFELEAQSRRWIARHAPLLAQVAGERVLAEVEKLAAVPGGHHGLQACLKLELLQPWGADPQAERILEGLDVASAEARGLTAEELAWALPLARLAALFGSQALATLRSSRRLQMRCQNLRRWQSAAAAQGLRKAGVLSEAELLQLHRDLEADLPALALHLPVADAQTALRCWRNPVDPLFHPKPPIDGSTLQKHLHLKPGRQLGDLLQHLMLERAFGRLPDACLQDGGHGPLSPGLAAVLTAAQQWLDGQTSNPTQAHRQTAP